MKVLLSVVGIGLGHATRCEALYRELSKEAEVKVMTWGSAVDYFKKAGVDAGTINGYEYLGEQYSFDIFLQILDAFREPLKLKNEYFSFARQVNAFKPDIVLSDSDPNAFFYAHRRKLPNYVLSNLVTTIDNYEVIPRDMRNKEMIVQNFMISRLTNFITKRADKVFVPSFETKVRYHEDVKYTDLILRKKMGELASENKLKDKLCIDKDFYLVSVGGSEIEKYLFEVLRKVLPQFKDKYFLVSSNNVSPNVIREENMTIFPFVKNFLEYLKISKGMIAPAGHSTISEAVCFKKPMLAFPVRNHIEQTINAALLKRDGLGEAGFFKQKITTAAVKEALEEFFKNEDKIKRKLDSFRFRGDGAKQISNAVLGLQ